MALKTEQTEMHTSNQIHINIFGSCGYIFWWCIHKTAEYTMFNRLLPWLFVICTDFLLIPKSINYSNQTKKNRPLIISKLIQKHIKYSINPSISYSPSDDFTQFHNLTFMIDVDCAQIGDYELIWIVEITKLALSTFLPWKKKKKKITDNLISSLIRLNFGLLRNIA